VVQRRAGARLTCPTVWPHCWTSQQWRPRGFEVLDARYFMFFLSPLLWLSRAWTGRKARALSEAETRRLAERMHRVPIWPVNAILAAAFFAETPLGHYIRFPFGTSLLEILRKPAEREAQPTSVGRSASVCP